MGKKEGKNGGVGLAIVQLTREPPLGENHHLAVGPNVFLARQRFVHVRAVEKKEKKKKRICLQRPLHRYTERGVERDPIKLISTVPILICCPEIIPFHRVNSLVLFDSRYTR